MKSILVPCTQNTNLLLCSANAFTAEHEARLQHWSARCRFLSPLLLAQVGMRKCGQEEGQKAKRVLLVLAVASRSILKQFLLKVARPSLPTPSVGSSQAEDSRSLA